MPLWAGTLSVPLEAEPLKDIRISAPNHASIPSTLIPRRSQLSFLGYIDPSCVPLWMAAGPSLDVYTTNPETELFFRNILCTSTPLGDEFEEGRSAEQSAIGILVKVRQPNDDEESSSSDGGNTTGDWAVTELLFYGSIITTEVTLPDTPPNSSPAKPPRESSYEGNELVTRSPVRAAPATTKVTTVTVHALPLSSHHNYAAPLRIKSEPSESLSLPPTRSGPITPANRAGLSITQCAQFIAPNPLDSPQISKSVKKRRADALSQAVENRKKQRFLSTGPAPSRKSVPPPMTLLGGGGCGGGVTGTKQRATREPSVGRGFLRERENSSVPHARRKGLELDLGLSQHLSRHDRSPSPEKRPCTSASSASFSSTKLLKRETTIFEDGGYPKLLSSSATTSRPGTSHVSSLKRSTTIPPLTPAFENEEDKALAEFESKNKDALSRIVMTGMRMYGLKRGTSSSSTTTITRPVSRGSRLGNTDENDPAEGGDEKSALVKFDKDNSREKDKKDADEFKYVYHNTFKAAVFALRNTIQAESLSPTIMSEVVDKLLAIFCQPLAIPSQLQLSNPSNSASPPIPRRLDIL